MDYDKLIQSLRVCGTWEGSCEGCKEYDGNGCKGSPEKLMTEAADAIEFFRILANNYGKAVEALSGENARQKAEIKQDNEICKKCYESRVLAETRSVR